MRGHHSLIPFRALSESPPQPTRAAKPTDDVFVLTSTPPLFWCRPNFSDLKKSDAITKLKEGARRITQVSPSGLEKALSSATGSLQVVLVRLPFCKGSEELRPGLEELAQESSGADFFEVTLKDSRGDSGDLLGDVWLSPTVKAFKDGQQVAQAEEPAVEDVQRILRS